jgi:hypothetical protein
VYPIDDLVRDGTMRGAEYSLAFYNLYGPPATVTADVVFYPKYMTFVAEDAAWSRLSADQRGIIEEAATTARDELLSTRPETRELVAAFCAQGGRSVLAGEANVAAFQAAAQPIYDKMREDSFTAAALAAITALKATTDPGPAVQACEPVSQEGLVPVASQGPDIGLVPDGTYVLSHTKQELLDLGVNEIDAGNNAGDWTWRFAGDQGSWTLDHPNGYHEVCNVKYIDRGDHIRAEFIDGCPGWVDLRWALDGDQLRLTVINDAVGTAYEVAANNAILGGSWTKVE